MYNGGILLTGVQEFYAVAWTTLTFNTDGVEKRSNILAVGGMLICRLHVFSFHSILLEFYI